MGLTADRDITFVAICSKESKLYWMFSVQVRGERVHISVSQWVNLHLLLFLAYLAADFRFTLQSITDDRYKGVILMLLSVSAVVYMARLFLCMFSVVDFFLEVLSPCNFFLQLAS